MNNNTLHFCFFINKIFTSIVFDTIYTNKNVSSNYVTIGIIECDYICELIVIEILLVHF